MPIYVPTTKIRYSYTCKPVTFERVGAQWRPTNGRFVRVKSGKITVAVLCHDTDRDPPKRFDYEQYAAQQ